MTAQSYRHMSERAQVKIGNQMVTVKGYKAKQVVDSTKFKVWIKTIDTSQFNIKDITVRWADFTPRGLLFAYLDCDVEDQEGNWVPGIVFFRGSSIGVLTVLIDEIGQTSILLVKQPRFPAGTVFSEIPTGMIDGNGNPIGVAFTEMKEETGIILQEEGLLPLGVSSFTSPGGTDEMMHIFYTEVRMSAAEIHALQGRLTGATDEDEKISLEVVPINKARSAIGTDMKSMLALLEYAQLHGWKV